MEKVYTNDDLGRKKSVIGDKSTWLLPPKQKLPKVPSPYPYTPGDPGAPLGVRVMSPPMQTVQPTNTVTGTSTLTGKPTRDQMFPTETLPLNRGSRAMLIPSVRNASAGEAQAETGVISQPGTPGWSDNPNDYPAPVRGPITPVQGSINYDLRGGDPKTAYDPASGATLPAADRGRFASGAEYDVARKAYNELDFQTLPDGSKQILPYRESNDLMSASGREDGGQVMQATTTDPETLKLIAERRAAVLPAQESYNRTLDEANMLESAHGTRAGNRAQLQIAALRDQQMKAFADKHGVDLKSMEFQATLPKIAAETEYYRARGDQAKASAANGQKSLYDQGILETMKQAQAAMFKPKDIMESDEEYQARIETNKQISENAHNELLRREEERGSKQRQATPPAVKEGETRISQTDGKTQLVFTNGKWQKA